MRMVRLLVGVLSVVVLWAPAGWVEASTSPPVPGFVSDPGGISGVVTAADGDVAGVVWAVALRVGDYRPAAAAVTDGSGRFDLGGLAPGGYLLYGVDPSGRLLSGFGSGGAGLVTVTAGESTVAPPVRLEAAVGSLSGTVHGPGGAPAGGMWAMVLSAGLSDTGRPVRVVNTDEAGRFRVDGLAPGRYFVGWADPAGRLAARFWPDAMAVPEATPVTVDAGSVTVADGTVPAQTAPAGTAALDGTVTGPDGSPVGTARVVALRADDYQFVGAAEADDDGRFRLGGLTPGGYRVAFVDETGAHTAEWSGDVPLNDLAGSAAVAAPGDVPAALDRFAGSVSGVVTDSRSMPLTGMMVAAIGSDGRAFGTTTGSDGRYLVDGLAPGGYRVITVDPSGQRAAGPAVSVTVTSGQPAAVDLPLDAPSVTVETSAGWPLEEFPFPVMVAPPHRPHDPVTGFAAATVDSDGAWRFETPTVTSPDGLYGNFWVTPRPPTPGARLAGVRFVDASWEGRSANSIVVFSLLDRAVENNAAGTVTGAVQGLPGELVGVLFDRQSDTIDMLLDEPAAVPEGRFVAAVDTENLPMGDPETVFPSRIDVGRVEWLWAPPTRP